MTQDMGNDFVTEHRHEFRFQQKVFNISKSVPLDFAYGLVVGKMG